MTTLFCKKEKDRSLKTKRQVDIIASIAQL
jgi:hypothetical protein